MPAVLLLVGLFLFFVHPLPGALVFLVGCVLAKREDRHEKKHKVENETRVVAKNYYFRRKWTHPTSEETIEANEKQIFPTDHSKFLNKQIERLENDFRLNGIYPYFPQLMNWEAEDDSIDFLFDTPAKYLEVVNFLNRTPIGELVEDWNAQIVKDKANEGLIAVAKAHASGEKIWFLKSIKNRIITLSKEGVSWNEIISKIKTENANKVQLTVFRENGIWHAELGDEKIEFEVLD